MTSAEALELLATLGANAWLIRHHELVVEAAAILCHRISRELGLAVDRALVLAGAALHDVGKIEHPGEMSQPGHAHEAAGERLLVCRGVPAAIAGCCVSHAAWDALGVSTEELLVALADKLWKGKRVDELERLVADAIVATTGREPWAVFAALDAICGAIAADGDARLARSVV